MTNGTGDLRYLIDSYRDWAVGEGIPILEGVAVDLNAAATAPWPRLGDNCRGAFVHLRGRGDFVALQVIELAPGASTRRLRHVHDNVFHVLVGEGRAGIEAGARTHDIE